MYINDTHIGFFIAAAILGLFVGQFVDWLNERLPEYKKIFTREIFKQYKYKFKPNYILMLINAVIYVALVYRYGIQDTFIGNLNLIKYSLLTPMLLSAFVIDYRLQIIPNRLNLAMFEVGIVIAFLYGISNVAITIDLLLGMLLGAGIFLAITVIGSLIYRKETLGLGDVKLMGALGLYFGVASIGLISMMSFLIGAVIGVILIVTKIRKSDEYIPFGPFIVISTFISMFVPFNLLANTLMTIFTLGMFKR